MALATENPAVRFCCSGRRVACIPIVSQPTRLPLQGEILPVLELLATNLYRRWLLTRSIRYRFNYPLPVPTPILIKGQSRAAAAPDLHLPVVIVGRYCEHKRERGGDHDSA